jgi:hypothetical protein
MSILDPLSHEMDQKIQRRADGSAREALGMLLIPDENGKVVKSIEYFNTVSTPSDPPSLRLSHSLPSSINLISRSLTCTSIEHELIVDGDISRIKITPFQRNPPTYRDPI